MTSHDVAEKHHTISYGQYVLVWLSLVGFTGLTVALAGIELGRWIIVTALGIAGFKSLLVLNVFMHLKLEDRIFRLFVTIALAILLIFFTLTFFDYAFA